MKVTFPNSECKRLLENIYFIPLWKMWFSKIITSRSVISMWIFRLENLVGSLEVSLSLVINWLRTPLGVNDRRFTTDVVDVWWSDAAVWAGLQHLIITHPPHQSKPSNIYSWRCPLWPERQKPLSTNELTKFPSLKIHMLITVIYDGSLSMLPDLCLW
jgi:hypothetical protein